jgi:hypothetical protein
MARLKVKDRYDVLTPRDEAFMLELPADPGPPYLLTQRTWNFSFHMYSFKAGKL